MRWTRKRSRGGRSLAIAVRERLERARALVARLADRGEEERLLDPRLRVRQQVGARDEHGVVRRRAGREVGGAREEMGGPVLHRAEDAAVVVAIDRPPRSPLVLGALDPLALLGLAVAAGLPPDARLADDGAVSSVAPVRPARRDVIASRAGADALDDDVDRSDVRFAMRSRYSATRSCTSARRLRARPHSSSTCTSTSTVPSSRDLGRVARQPETPSTSSAASPAYRASTSGEMREPPSRRSYNELRDLRPREEAERHERRPEAGRDVQDRATVVVEPLDVARSEVREPELPAGVRDDDLARVEVAARGRGGRRRESAGRSPGSGRGGCGDRRPSSASCSGRASRAAYVCGSTPTIWTRRPRSSTSTASSPRSVTPSSASIAAGSMRCENGSRLSAKSWLPSTT